MKHRAYFLGLLCFGLFVRTPLLPAATEPLKLKIIYSSFTGAYTPLWIAVEEQLGKKYGIELESVYAGTRCNFRLTSIGL
jgi:hypothetical protein